MPIRKRGCKTKTANLFLSPAGEYLQVWLAKICLNKRPGSGGRTLRGLYFLDSSQVAEDNTKGGVPKVH
jgi:hypothetical protein